MPTTDKCAFWTPDFVRNNLKACMRTFLSSILERTTTTAIANDETLTRLFDGLASSDSPLDIPFYTDILQNRGSLLAYFPQRPPWEKYVQLGKSVPTLTSNLRCFHVGAMASAVRHPGATANVTYGPKQADCSVYWPDGNGDLKPVNKTNVYKSTSIQQQVTYANKDGIPDTPIADLHEAFPKKMYVKDKGLDIFMPYHQAFTFTGGVAHPVYKLTDLQTEQGIRTEEAKGVHRWLDYINRDLYEIEVATFDAVTSKKILSTIPGRTLASKSEEELIKGGANVQNGTWGVGDLLKFDDSFSDGEEFKQFDAAEIPDYYTNTEEVYAITGYRQLPKEDPEDEDEEIRYIISYNKARVYFSKNGGKVNVVSRKPEFYDGPEYFRSVYTGFPVEQQWLLRLWSVEDRPVYGFQSASNLTAEEIKDESEEPDPNRVENPFWDGTNPNDRPVRAKYLEYIGFAPKGNAWSDGSFENPQTDSDRQRTACYQVTLGMGNRIVFPTWPTYNFQPSMHMTEDINITAPDRLISYMCDYSRRMPYAVYSPIEVEGVIIRVDKDGTDATNAEWLSESLEPEYNQYSVGGQLVWQPDAVQAPDFVQVAVDFAGSDKTTFNWKESDAFITLVEGQTTSYPRQRQTTSMPSIDVSNADYQAGNYFAYARSQVRLYGTWRDTDITMPSLADRDDDMRVPYTIVIVASMSIWTFDYFYVDDDPENAVDEDRTTRSGLTSINQSYIDDYANLNMPAMGEGEDVVTILGEFSPGSTVRLSSLIGTKYQSHQGRFSDITEMRQIIVDPTDDRLRIDVKTTGPGTITPCHSRLRIRLQFYRKYNFDHT